MASPLHQEAGDVEMSEIYNPQGWRLFDELDVSLEPPGPQQLYELSAPYLGPGMRILDVGCRDAWYLIRLAERFGITGVGIDPVPWHIDRATSAIAQAGLDQQLTTELVGIEDFRVSRGPSMSCGAVTCWRSCRTLRRLCPRCRVLLRPPAPSSRTPTCSTDLRTRVRRASSTSHLASSRPTSSRQTWSPRSPATASP